MEDKNTESKSNFSGVKVHLNAFVDPKAELHDGVIVAPVSYTHLRAHETG